MARIGLIPKAFLIDSHNAIEDPNFLGPGATFTQTAPDLDLKRLLKLGLVPIKVKVGTQGGKIIAVNNNRNVTGRVMKNTRVTGTGDKPKALEHLSVGILPELAGITSAIDTPHLTSNGVRREAKLFWHAHKNSTLRNRIKVRLPDVNEGQPKRFSLPVPLTHVFGEKHTFALEWRR